jgi:hypothetical protein
VFSKHFKFDLNGAPNDFRARGYRTQPHALTVGKCSKAYKPYPAGARPDQSQPPRRSRHDGW